MDRRLAQAAASLALIVGIAACQPVDEGAGGSASPSPPASAGSSAAPAAPTDAPDETPAGSVGSDYGY